MLNTLGLEGKTMTTHGYYRAIISFLFIFLLAVLATGCGGGDGDKPSDGTTTSADGVVVQAGPVPIEVVSLDGNDGKSQTATLDGSNSKPTGAVTYAWSFTSRPDGSKAELQNASTANPSFVADIAGTYLVELVVTSNGVSARDVATVLVRQNVNDSPTGPKWNHPGLSSYCANCHDGNYVYDLVGNVAVTKSGDHLATSNMCQACHTTFGFELLVYFDHQEIINSTCSECHNGVTAIGKSIFHVATNAECDDCHTTISFVEVGPDGSYDHTGIDRACSACHNGKVAIGKYEGHFETDIDCGFCHTTISFQDAYVDHSGFKESGQICAECHGVTATGPSPGHPDMSVDCGICHSISTFSLDGVFNHSLVDSISQPCGVCHDGTFAKGKSFKPDHVDTSADCGSCHNTVAFVPAFEYDHSQFPEMSGDRCDRCHGNTNTGMHQNHIPIGDVTVALNIPPDLVGNFPVLDCSACHTPGTFTSGGFDHANLNTSVYTVVPVCSTCHDEIHAIGKPVNHIVTDLECDSCHLNTDSFAGAAVDHTNIIDGCLSCHDGSIAVGKPADTHVPVDALVDCSTCHAPYPDLNSPNTLGFVPAPNFDHQAVVVDPQNCDACHNGRFTTSNGNLTGKPRTTHIPTQQDCDSCHATDTFTVAAVFVHPDYSAGGCEGCHNGRFTTDTPSIMSKQNSSNPSGHLPTTQDCDVCHATTAAWSDLKPYTHEGITGDCASCHNGNYDGIGAIGAPSTQIHIENPNTDCVACHSTSDIAPNGVSFLNAFPDHSNLVNNCTRAGCHDAASPAGIYLASGAHTSPTDGNDCELCHIGGGTWTEAVFDHDNIPDTTRCDSCHDGTQATGKVDKLARTGVEHVTTTEDCRLCHNTTDFAGAAFNHQGIDSGCVDCHNGDTAIGKHLDHVPTNQDCYVCHQTTGFIPGLFAHTSTQISGVECQTCHNGRFATGKADKTGTPHVDTTLDCGSCHTTDTFVGGIFDHSQIGNQSCSSCHNGSDAKGQPTTGHIDSAAFGLDCGRCHTAGGSFLGATFDHQNLGNLACTDCHGPGGGATEQPSGHFVTVGSNVDCDACHTTTGWGDQGTFDHCPGNTGDTYNACGDYPGDHRAGKAACNDCHTTKRSDFVSYPDQSQYAPNCAGCHAGRFRSAGEHNSGGVGNNQSCGNARGCHKVNNSRFN